MFQTSCNSQSKTGKSRRRKSTLLNAANVCLVPAVQCEPLEQRVMLSVSGAILTGPYTVAGTTWNYSVTIPDLGSGTEPRTVIGPTTINGVSVIEIDTVLGGQTDKRYVTQEGSSGNYVEVEDDTVFSGGESDESFSPPQLIFPASMKAGVKYESNSTETKTDNFGEGTPTVSTVDQDLQYTLISENPTAISLPYGTLKVYQIHQIETDTTTDDQGNSTVHTSSDDIWCAPGIGIVKVLADTGGYYELASFVSKSERLNFSQEPTDTDKDATIAPIQVSVLESTGVVDSNAVGSITLSLNSAGGDGKITGTMTEPLVNGVATFNDLKVDAGGTYTLSAVDDATPPVTMAVSDPFNIDVSALTWTGAGDGVNWSDPKNWDGNVKPVNGDNLIFPGGSPLTSNNDLTGLSLASIDIQGSGYELTGNAISLTDDLTSETGNNTYNINTTLVGSPTFSDVGGDLTIAAVLSGDGIKFSGNGILTIEKSNIYTGQTDLNSGVTIDDNVASGAFGTGTVVVDNNSSPVTIDASVHSGNVTLSNSVKLNGNLSAVTAATGSQSLELSGAVTAAAPATVKVSGGLLSGVYDLMMDNVSGASPITFSGNASLALNNAANLVGINLTNLISATLNGQLTGSVTVGTGATLELPTSGADTPVEGNGTIDVQNGGTLSTDPTSGATGLANYTGNVTLEAGGTIEDYDTVDRNGLGTGTLDLKGGTLEDSATGNGTIILANSVTLEGNVTLSPGASSSLDLSGKVTSTAPSTVKVTGGLLGSLLLDNLTGSSSINFTGNGTLKMDKAVEALAIGIDDAINGRLSGDDFTGVIKVANGGTLELETSGSATPVKGNGTIDVLGGGTLMTDPTAGATGLPDYTGSIILETGGMIEDYDTVDKNGLGTGTLDLKGGTLEDAAGANVTLDNLVVVDGNATLNSQGNRLKFSQDVDINASETLYVIGTVALDGSLIGSGDLELDGGALDIAGSNPNYSGDVTLKSGVIEVVQNNALGTGTLTVDTPDQITLESVSTIGDPLLPNHLRIHSGRFVIDGQFTFPAGVTVDAGATLDIEGANSNVIISGPLAGGGNVVIGSGELTLPGGSTSFTGGISLKGDINRDGTVDAKDLKLLIAAMGTAGAQPQDGDANGDGNVNFTDLVAVAQHYGQHNATLAKGDFNGDGTVDFADLVTVAQHYGHGGPADLNGDGIVNFQDFQILELAYGLTLPLRASVPASAPAQLAPSAAHAALPAGNVSPAQPTARVMAATSRLPSPAKASSVRKGGTTSTPPLPLQRPVLRSVKETSSESSARTMFSTVLIAPFAQPLRRRMLSELLQ